MHCPVDVDHQDNIRFDTSLMTRIFLKLYLEASESTKPKKNPQNPLDLHVDRSPTPNTGTAAVFGVGAIAGMADCSPERVLSLELAIA
ncbi:unnamed protein product [Bursaphelenchus xylophilus]|uniref:(pine wood nematode) hypothetical protein n=1 Tax=Bursaphelenchus xylophilus TaxID=6326 RepID=A0A7I8XQL8_BURXY|nr:unnamed protein product [Bursaphelenchus xylophilus]CAG9087545.1 unnamed protein product [Bursaphelenchus xylophilus]